MEKFILVSLFFSGFVPIRVIRSFMVAKLTAFGIGLFVASTTFAQVTLQAMPDNQVGQSIADIFRMASGSDIAFVASGFLTQKGEGKNLAAAFQFPADELWQVSLTGKQLNDAFERSLSFYPEPCPDTLYFSGGEVMFSAPKTSRPKIIGATIGGLALDPTKSYKVSMPASLARGGLSYFAVWNFQRPEKVISSSISKLLEGKSVQTSTLRWLSRQSL